MKTKYQITKRQALNHYRSGAALADALGISRQAVSALPDGPLNGRQTLTLLELHAEEELNACFTKTKDQIQRRLPKPKRRRKGGDE